MRKDFTIAACPAAPQHASLRASLLAAREERQARLDELFPAPYPATVMLSLNLPGDAKGGERAGRLFAWGEQALAAALEVHPLFRGWDALGPFGLYRCGFDAVLVKRSCIRVESSHPAGRLLDLDIFDHAGRPVDRSGLGIAPRSCLLCPEPALACIRAERHASAELQARAHQVIDAL